MAWLSKQNQEKTSENYQVNDSSGAQRRNVREGEHMWVHGGTHTLCNSWLISYLLYLCCEHEVRFCRSVNMLSLVHGLYHCILQSTVTKPPLLCTTTLQGRKEHKDGKVRINPWLYSSTLKAVILGKYTLSILILVDKYYGYPERKKNHNVVQKQSISRKCMHKSSATAQNLCHICMFGN